MYVETCCWIRPIKSISQERYSCCDCYHWHTSKNSFFPFTKFFNLNNDTKANESNPRIALWCSENHIEFKDQRSFSYVCVCVFEHSALLDSDVASLKKTHRQVDYTYLRVIKDDEVLCQWTDGHRFITFEIIHDTDVQMLLVLWETPKQLRLL